MIIDEDVGTTITVNSRYGVCSISVNKDIGEIHEFKDELLWPLLLAISFQPETIEEILGERC